jgi:hypothetical protein
MVTDTVDQMKNFDVELSSPKINVSFQTTKNDKQYCVLHKVPKRGIKALKTVTTVLPQV